jgi:hypothetical protein
MPGLVLLLLCSEDLLAQLASSLDQNIMQEPRPDYRYANIYRTPPYLAVAAGGGWECIHGMDRELAVQ